MMKLALQNLIISEATCQNWKRSELKKKAIETKQELIKVGDYCSIDAFAKGGIQAQNF
ncbi:MAG: hypothetical protein QNJ38_16955 [Prochloraceae cyanobacterium]|nr:hypothetical protein [Prochloraceae cyanobacterium]